MMDIRKLVFALVALSLAGLACSLTQGAAIQPSAAPPTSSPVGSGTVTLPKTNTPQPSATNTPPTSSPTRAAQACRVETGQPGGNLNVRRGPGVSFPVVGLAHEGDTLTVISQPGDWWQVNAGQLTGYIFSRFCLEISR